MPIQFGSFELDQERLELRQCGTRIDMPARALETLLFLVTHRERLITKEEILAKLWEGMAVSEAALSQVIHQLWAALGDDPKAPRFIATVRGRGFRFIGELDEALSPRDSSPPSSRLRPLFGRRLETARLQLAANEGRAGHGNVVLIHGPPGVGKTRLAQWFATCQREAGMEICWGGCREGQSAPPFWPWPEILHRYAETRDAAAVEPCVRGRQHDLGVVAPELREALGVGAATTADESPERAQAVFDAIVDFVHRAAEQSPLTLVLEDLHLADDMALRLVEAIARSIADTQLMILGTFRRIEGSSRPVLRAALEGSTPNVQALALDGLSLDDVRTWLSTTSATPLPDPVVEGLHFSSDGLPLLVEAIVDELPTWEPALLSAHADKGVAVHGRVKQILGRRIQRLDGHTIGLLRTAAVFGEEFPIALLATVTGEALTALLPRLDLAQQQGVLKPATAGCLRFAHALHQELLYTELSSAERRREHAVIGRAFADSLVRQPDNIVQTAYHFLEALPHADRNDAVFFAQKAAEWARTRHAYARSAEYYQRALAVLDMDAADPHQYGELLLALGSTQAVAGAVDDAIATLERTFDLTRSHGYYDLFCRAILIWFQLRRESCTLDPVFHARVAEALANVQERDVVFAQLQVARAMATMFTSPISERVAWLEEALDLTRDTADPRLRIEVLRGALICYTYFTDGTTEMGLADEMLQLAVALRSTESELDARRWRAHSALVLGQGSVYEQEVATYCRHAAQANAPHAAWMAGVLCAGQHFLAGSLGESERAARDAGRIGQDLMGPNGYVHMISQLFQIGLEYEGEDG
ncbi:MAG TPA: AAA family ATPase, partial [Polyangiaceae bacterium]|nr:AAA family ATPase [Polyangiaceae bacterium]